MLQNVTRAEADLVSLLLVLVANFWPALAWPTYYGPLPCLFQPPNYSEIPNSNRVTQHPSPFYKQFSIENKREEEEEEEDIYIKRERERERVERARERERKNDILRKTHLCGQPLKGKSFGARLSQRIGWSHSRSGSRQPGDEQKALGSLRF